MMTPDLLKVTSVTSDGFWITINETEYFCPFDKFKWFRGARIEEIFKVKGDAEHLYWGKLNIDLNESYFQNNASIIRPVQ